MYNKLNISGVLIECGFLTNREEEAMLRSEDYQKKLAAVFASTLVLQEDKNLIQ